MIIGSEVWTAAIANEPGKATAALIGLLIMAVAVCAGLRQLNRHARSLRRQVLAIMLASLAIGAVSSLALAWLMVLDAGELGVVLSVLLLTAVSATAVVFLASSPLGKDAERLEATVKAIERGDRAIRSNVDRVDELGHVARALDDLTQRLDQLEHERERYESERSAMLSSVGHDLRTPIAALQAAVESLVDGIAPDPQRYLASMQRDIEALSSLVNDLFLLVRIDNGRLEMPATTVDLSEIADEAIEALTPVAVDRGVELVLAAPGGVRVKGNASALGRVIRNLLDNAIRHAPEGSTVEVTVDRESRRVVVADQGPGFAPSFADQAFDRFTRADASRNRDTGGAGLGLAIARGVVEAHGGHIWVGAPPGGHVAFELPAA